MSNAIILVLYFLLFAVLYKMHNSITKLQSNVERRMSALENDLEEVRKTVDSLVQRLENG